MTTIHLTDAQRDTFAACGLIVMDGEYSSDGSERALQRMQQLNMPQGSDKLGRPYHQVTGHPLLAPEGWRILTAPCDTCGGLGGINHDETGRGEWCPNPDCVGGRRVFALEHNGETLGRFVLLALTPNDDGTFTASVEAVD